jgi:hypothetical protein
MIRGCAKILSSDEQESVYPYVFSIRNNAHPPKDLQMRAGYYCIDAFTPLNKNVYLAAHHAVDCALTAAQAILDGAYLAYALIRPPGHHAEKDKKISTTYSYSSFTNGLLKLRSYQSGTILHLCCVSRSGGRNQP